MHNGNKKPIYEVCCFLYNFRSMQICLLIAIFRKLIFQIQIWNWKILFVMRLKFVLESSLQQNRKW